MTPEERQIEDTLQMVYRREGNAGAVNTDTPLSALLRAEEGDAPEHAEIRREAFVGLMQYFFADGPHPGNCVRRVFAVAKAVQPELVKHMSLEELGLLFGETKAAQSWRIKKIFNGYLRASGATGTHARFQKTEGAVSNYRAAQQGNTNRRGKTKRK